ncbi:hypothetical protein HA62_23370 [Pseudomonas putida]|nr:hypothetical protein HA62_23370 [Pseudomonas putida]
MELKNYFAQDQLGNALPGATCYLYDRGTENLVSPLIKANGERLTNPFTTSPSGMAQFAAANGIYDLRIVQGPRDYRVNIQCNDVTEDVAAATAAAARAEVARDAAQLSSGVFQSVASGLAATPDGKYFSVPSTASTESMILYKNNAGSASEVTRYPSVGSVTEIARRTLAIPNLAASRIPLVATEQGQVALWLEDGLLAAPNLAPALREAVLKEVISRSAAPTSQMLPLIMNEIGQVVMWLEKGRVNAAGLGSSIREVIQEVVKATAYNPAMMPLMFTEGGQVALWMKDGRFNAAGLHTTINELIQAALVPYNAVKVTDGSSLFAYREKIANALGGNGIARVIFTGDSWTEHLAETAQPLSKALYDAYGQSGQGWVGMDADEGGASSTKSQLLNGARLIKSAGWQLADMNPANTDSLDGHSAIATGVSDTINITGLKTQALKWYYKDADGVFRYTVDGGTPVTIVCGNTGLKKSFDITGLADAAHSIVFDLVGNTGTVTMYGGMATRTESGVEFSKAGNGGSTAVQWKSIAPFVEAYAADIKPDLAIIILGTNDKNQNIAKVDFKSGVQALVDAYRVGSPNCGIVLVTPTLARSDTDLGLLVGYAEAMAEISKATAGVEFINLNAYMPPRATSYALGLWADSLHLSEAGGRFVTGLLMKYFLKTN